MSKFYGFIIHRPVQPFGSQLQFWIIFIGMGIVSILAVLYSMVGASVYLLSCITPHRPNLLAKLYSILYVKVPAFVGSILKKIVGETYFSKLAGVRDYVMRTNHPIAQIVYLATMIMGLIAYDLTGVFRYMPNKLVSRIHIVMIHILFAVCLHTYYKVCITSPGKIDATNQEYYVTKYSSKYDNIMYRKSNKCRTCNVEKPAGSKHCTACGICVPNFDHHCIWTRRCIGEKNKKYYLIFLLCHTVFALYLAVIGAYTLKAVLDAKRLESLKLNYANKQINNVIIVLSFLFIQNTLFCLLIIVCFLAGACLIVFDSYQLYLIKSDKTDNERRKHYRTSVLLKEMIEQAQTYVKQQGGVDKLPQQVALKGEHVSREQFIKGWEDNKRDYQTLTAKHPSNSVQRFVQSLKEIFVQ